MSIVNVNDQIGTGINNIAHVQIILGLRERAPTRDFIDRRWRNAIVAEGGYCIDAPDEIPAGGCRPYEEPDLPADEPQPQAAEQITTWRE